MFSRVKKNKQKIPEQSTAPVAENPTTKDVGLVARAAPDVNNAQSTKSDTAKPVRKKPPKMSFSTPKPMDEQPVRRSKRLSNENESRGSPVSKPKPRPKDEPPQHEAEPVKKSPPRPKNQEPVSHNKDIAHEDKSEAQADHASTRIALPFADTPVIRRNKAMRENKSGKGERRSSLSLRGRRASSLIESGNSSALPHSEVEISDFYKHIESDGLPEPRRMRQLLIWTATRCLDQREMGGNFEDSSAVSAARVVEEELLKDLANRSELSDWFAREDTAQPPKELPERPNPKNLQNGEKIKELEEQIKRYVYACSDSFLALTYISPDFVRNEIHSSHFYAHRQSQSYQSNLSRS